MIAYKIVFIYAEASNILLAMVCKILNFFIEFNYFLILTFTEKINLYVCQYYNYIICLRKSYSNRKKD